MDDAPVVEDGIHYWETQPATYDGVLGMSYRFQNLRPLTPIKGGFGTGVITPSLAK